MKLYIEIFNGTPNYEITFIPPVTGEPFTFTSSGVKQFEVLDNTTYLVTCQDSSYPSVCIDSVYCGGTTTTTTTFSPTTTTTTTTTIPGPTTTTTTTSSAYTVLELYSDGTWTCPVGYTRAIVHCIGGGGGGSSSTSRYAMAGGGGGGAYSNLEFAVTPGSAYSYSQGGGGNVDSNGWSSWFISNVTCYASGGAYAGYNNKIGGLGGSSTVGYGDVKYSGGNGSDGTYNVHSGSGGGSAGSTGDGGDGGYLTGGIGGTGSYPIGGPGNGGAGVIVENTRNNGDTYGGGGSGSCRFSSSISFGGGAGGRGGIILELFST